MEDIIKIIFGGAFSFGAIGTIIVYLMKKYADGFAEKLQKKYAFEFDKEIEKLKSSLDGKNYITQKQFDIEFEIYRSLSKSFFEMLVSLKSMYSLTYCLDENYHKTKSFEDVKRFGKPAGNKIIRAQDCLHENKAFITKELFEKYDEILASALGMYLEYMNELKKAGLDKKLPDNTIRDKSWNDVREESTKILLMQLDKLNDELREYLHTLKIID